MPGRLLPDDLTMDAYLRRGFGPAEIAVRLVEDHGVHVTPEAVTTWRRRRHGDTHRQERSELVPWTVQRAHKDLYPIKMLRLEARRRKGEQLPPHMAEALDAWIKKLKDNHAVVHYDPEVAPYWFYISALEGEDLVHVPDA